MPRLQRQFATRAGRSHALLSAPACRLRDIGFAPGDDGRRHRARRGRRFRSGTAARSSGARCHGARICGASRSPPPRPPWGRRAPGRVRGPANPTPQLALLRRRRARGAWAARSCKCLQKQTRHSALTAVRALPERVRREFSRHRDARSFGTPRATRARAGGLPRATAPCLIPGAHSPEDAEPK